MSLQIPTNNPAPEKSYARSLFEYAWKETREHDKVELIAGLFVGTFFGWLIGGLTWASAGWGFLIFVATLLTIFLIHLFRAPKHLFEQLQGELRQEKQTTLELRKDNEMYYKQTIAVDKSIRKKEDDIETLETQVRALQNELDSLKAKPNIECRIDLLFLDFGLTWFEKHRNSIWLAIKYRIVNRSDASSNIENFEVYVKTAFGYHAVTKYRIDRLEHRLEENDLIYTEDLTDIDQRKDALLIRGQSESWWFRGFLPDEFKNELEDASDIDSAYNHIKQVNLVVTDGFGNRHETVSLPSSNRKGEVRQTPPVIPDEAFKIFS
jgi:hypothetical protein